MSGAACVPNIGPRIRRRRLAGGLLALAGGVVLLGALALAGAPRAARLLAALPLWAGILGILQARERT